MKSKFTSIFFFFVLNQVIAQTTHPLLDSTKKWILLNNKIEKNEIFLAKYHPAKLRANSLVLSFVSNGRLSYTYESNPKIQSTSSIDFLDIDLEESRWKFDSLAQELTLTIKGGYASLSDFRFSRNYSIESVSDGFILIKSKNILFENLKNFSKNKILVNPPQAASTKIIEKKVEILKTEVVPPTEKIDYQALFAELFSPEKRWILMKNKIERGDIYLTPYAESKLSINNLVLTLNKGKIDYDYESDPKINMCLGVDFLDIDSENSSWKYDAENNIFTLVIKGGYASLDDFQFSRAYKIETFEDGYVLRKFAEIYFNDFRKKKKK